MSLYFVFTIDGDWEEYYDHTLPEEKRQPDRERLVNWINQEIKIAARYLEGRFIHFIHTSPRARDFFLRPAFVSLWREIEENNGSVGIHCHEDDPQLEYYFDDEVRMEKAIKGMADGLREKGLAPLAYRGGYLAFSLKTIPILERNNIFLDFSCEPDRHLFHGDRLVSDWRQAPDNFYRMSYEDHRKAGESKVFEIPLGIYIELDSLREIREKARALKNKKKRIIVSVLTHSYEYGSFFKRLKIKLALLILRRYGKFLNAREVLERVNK